MSQELLYVVNPDVSCREEGDEGTLLFNPDTDQVLVINITGYLIWQALEQPARQAEAVAALLEQCDNAAPEQVAEDVREFIERMVDKGFIAVAQSAGA